MEKVPGFSSSQRSSADQGGSKMGPKKAGDSAGAGNGAGFLMSENGGAYPIAHWPNACPLAASGVG